jgi:hypothetical protein
VRYTQGLLKSTTGPFSGLIFYAQPEPDVLNRVQFRIYTWHGEESTEDWEQGGWWHFNSIVWDESGISLFSEVTCFGAEMAAHYSWPAVSEEQEDLRRDDLYDSAKAWPWISDVLSGPLGLVPLDGDEKNLANTTYRAELKKQGVAVPD